MSHSSRLEALPAAAHTVAGKIPDTLAEEAIESVEGSEVSLQFCPVRGILTAVVIGAGAWMIILGTAALARAIFFG
jgi:hypothetical protein